MEFSENNIGYEAMVWVNDSDGREFACYRDDIRNPENLSEEEKEKCLNVNALVGTERW